MIHWRGRMDVRKLGFVVAADGVSGASSDRGEKIQEALQVALKKKELDSLTESLKQGALLTECDAEGYPPLHVACLSAWVEGVQQLLIWNADPKQATAEGWKPLHLAAMGGSKQITYYLLTMNVDPTEVGPGGATALHLAAEKGHRAVAEQLRATAANFDATDEQGRTPLYLACAGGHADMVQYLLQSDGKVGEVDREGRNCFHALAAGGHTHLIQLLLNKGREHLDRADMRGETPLHVACRNNCAITALALIKVGADPLALDHNQSLAPEVAAKAGHVETAQIVAEELGEREGAPLFHWACKYRQRELVNILMRHGLQPAGVDNEGKSALYWAAQMGLNDLVRQLLLGGIECEAVDREGRTPLYGACFGEREDTFQILSGLGASSDRVLLAACKLLEASGERRAPPVSTGTEIPLDEATTEFEHVVQFLITSKKIPAHAPLYVSIHEGYSHAALIFLDKQEKTKWFPLHLAAEVNRASVARALLEGGVDSEKRNEGGLRALEVACISGSTEVALYLSEKSEVTEETLRLALEAGKGETAAAVCAFLARKEGFTLPLHWAIAKERGEAFKVLLSQGASVSEADGEGITPLHIAARVGNLSFARALVEGGAKTGAKDLLGRTALFLANNPAIAQFLLPEGDPTIDTEGRCALHTIPQGAICRVLLEAGMNFTSVDSLGRSPLHYPKDGDGIDAFTERGLSVEVPDREGMTPLQAAYLRGDLTMVDALKVRGAKVNGTDLLGQTALHLLCIEATDPRKRDQVLRGIEHCLNKGGDPVVPDRGGQIPLQKIVERGFATSVIRLIEGRGFCLLVYAYGLMNEEREFCGFPLFTYFYDLGAEWRAGHEVSIPLLVLAAQEQREEIFGFVLTKYRETSIREAALFPDGDQREFLRGLLDAQDSIEGDTALNAAVKVGNLDLARQLVEAGATVDLGDYTGTSPFQVAAKSRNIEIARLLRGGGANVNRLDGRGLAALHYLSNVGVADEIAVMPMIRALVTEMGANINWGDIEGWCPLDYAYLKGLYHIAAFLDLREGARANMTGLRMMAWRWNAEFYALPEDLPPTGVEGGADFQSQGT